MADRVRQYLIREEAFLADRHLKGLLKKLVDAALKDFNFDRLSARDVAAATLKERLTTLPMMAEARTVVIDDFHLLNKDAAEALLPALCDAQSPSHIILVADKADKRTTHYKALAAAFAVHEFKKPYANQVPEVLRDEAKRLGLTFGPGALELLIEASGVDLQLLVTEIEKLALYIHPQTRIERRHVEDATAEGVLENIFLIGNLIGERRLAAARDIFRRMIEQGESAVKITALVAGHFRKLTLAKAALSTGRGSQLASLLKISPFFAKDYEKQATRFALSELKDLYRRLMNLTESQRSSPVDRNTLFEHFLTETCLTSRK